MVLKHTTRSTDKIVDNRRAKLVAAKREVTALKKAFTKKTESNEAEFNRGFVLSLILLCRSYEPLHEHAFNILQEAGYELTDFNHTKLDPTDRETLHKIFST